MENAGQNNKVKLLITSMSDRSQIKNSSNYSEPKIKNINKINRSNFINPIFSFPKLLYSSTNKGNRNFINEIKKNYSNWEKMKITENKINLKKMELFLHPLNKLSTEKIGIKTLKENLIKNKFNQFHKYKLKINPKNYYHNYGLNNFILITSNNSNKKNENSYLDYQFNNVSSYNSTFFKKEEEKRIKTEKKDKFNNLKNSKSNKIYLSSLKNIPIHRIKSEFSDYVIKTFNDDKKLVNINSLYRSKNINELINNSANLNFFKYYFKHHQSLGKLKEIN